MTLQEKERQSQAEYRCRLCTLGILGAIPNKIRGTGTPYTVSTCFRSAEGCTFRPGMVSTMSWQTVEIASATRPRITDAFESLQPIYHVQEYSKLLVISSHHCELDLGRPPVWLPEDMLSRSESFLRSTDSSAAQSSCKALVLSSRARLSIFRASLTPIGVPAMHQRD